MTPYQIGLLQSLAGGMCLGWAMVNSRKWAMIPVGLVGVGLMYLGAS